jgi:hypothetical protein
LSSAFFGFSGGAVDDMTHFCVVYFPERGTKWVTLSHA